MTCADSATQSEAADIASRLETLAEEGDWESMADLSKRLRSAVMHAPEAARRDLLEQLQDCTATLTDVARLARTNIQKELRSVRRGHAATDAYHAVDQRI